MIERPERKCIDNLCQVVCPRTSLLWSAIENRVLGHALVYHFAPKMADCDVRLLDPGGATGGNHDGQVAK